MINIATLFDAPQWQFVIVVAILALIALYTFVTLPAAHISPKWLKWVIGISILLAMQSVVLAWGERRFIAAFAEAFVANAFFWGIGIGALVSGYLAEDRLARLTSHRWLAIMGGFLGGLLVALTLMVIAYRIPGVNERIEQIIELRERYEDDY